ncbi:hypothetical protein [Paenibacillus sp. NPDC057967]|uniref:hypothetical protein n=1 Tax=Paenibacillus sp. NPDC057967 TaxID=3346293 RepID=UPI0036D96896
MHTNQIFGKGSKLLWLIVPLLITASWVGNLWFYHSMQLEKPFFLNHYMVLNGNYSDWIELSYVENRKNGKKVTGIRLEELPMLRFQINPHPGTYRHQVLGKAYGEWRKEDFGQMEQVPFSIKEATVYYNEGAPEKVPIGEIRVDWEKSDGLLQMSSSSGSSDGTGQYSVTVNQSLVLEQIDYSFGDRLSPIFELSAAGRNKAGAIPQLPIRLAAGDPLTFSYKWNIPQEMPAASEVYKVYISLTFKTEDGKTVRDRIPVNFNLYLSEKQIKWLVRSGGERS